jgi:hypothetical protein
MFLAEDPILMDLQKANRRLERQQQQQKRKYYREDNEEYMSLAKKPAKEKENPPAKEIHFGPGNEKQNQKNRLIIDFKTKEELKEPSNEKQLPAKKSPTFRTNEEFAMNWKCYHPM